MLVKRDNIDFYVIQKKNQNKIIFLIISFIIFCGLMGLLFDFSFRADFIPPYFALGGIGYAGVMVVLSLTMGGNFIKRVVGAQPAVKFRTLPYRRLLNIVQELSIASGIPPPEVYIIDDSYPNAMVVGNSLNRMKLCVTRGLLTQLDRDELQGVVAHEFAHIKNGDTITMTVVAALWGTVLLLAHLFLRMSWFGKGGRIRPQKGGVKGFSLIIIVLGFLLALLTPILSRIIAMAISRSMEYRADALGVEFTRNPLGLLGALEKIKESKFKMKGTYQSISYLFISDPIRRDIKGATGVMADLFQTHPPIEKRINILKKMAHIRGMEPVKKKKEPQYLLCPDCGKGMNEVVLMSTRGLPVKVDQCKKCGGIWFDRWELYTLGTYPLTENLKKPDLNIFFNPAQATKHIGVCPHCGIKLTKFKDRNIPEGVVFLRCELCGGIWLNFYHFKKFLKWRQSIKKLPEKKEELLKKKLAEELKKIPDIPSRRFENKNIHPDDKGVEELTNILMWIFSMA